MSSTKVEFPIEVPDLPMYRGDAPGRNGMNLSLKVDPNAPELVDLTTFGTTWKSQARPVGSGGDTIDLVVDASDAADGVLHVSIPLAKSADLPNILAYDVQVTGGAISPLTVWAGKFVASGQVTT